MGQKIEREEVLLEYKDAIPGCPGWHRGSQNLWQRSRVESLRPQKRKLVSGTGSAGHPWEEVCS